MKTLLALMFLSVATVASAQDIYARDGWEAFPMVEYQGGDATQPKKRTGYLVLTQDAIAIHPCRWNRCFDSNEDNRRRKIPPFETEPYFRIPLTQIKTLSSSSEVRGPGVGSRVMFGVLATDRSEGLVALTYESGASAEAPTFKAKNAAQSKAIDAKLRYRLKQLGIEVQ